MVAAATHADRGAARGHIVAPRRSSPGPPGRPRLREVAHAFYLQTRVYIGVRVTSSPRRVWRERVRHTRDHRADIAGAYAPRCANDVGVAPRDTPRDTPSNPHESRVYKRRAAARAYPPPRRPAPPARPERSTRRRDFAHAVRAPRPTAVRMRRAVARVVPATLARHRPNTPRFL